MYSFQRFNVLSAEQQINALSRHGVSLDLCYSIKNAEAVLFAYGDFYVELIVMQCTDEILSVKAFRSMKKLDAYLHQIDLSEINILLTCNR